MISSIPDVYSFIVDRHVQNTNMDTKIPSLQCRKIAFVINMLYTRNVQKDE